MRKVLKWIGVIFGVVIGLLVLAGAGLAIYGNLKFKPTFSDRPLYTITADTSPEGLARGKYLMEDAMSCNEACHSPEGAPFTGVYEELSMGPIQVGFAVPNLTPDQESGLGSWTDAEIARAIREGVDKDGVGLMVMPAYNYHVLSDADVAAIIGYLRNLEPVHNEIPPFSANLLAKVMAAMGTFGPSSVGEPITSAQSAPAPGTPEYGKYMVALGACSDCHGENLAGGPLPFAEPGSLPARNLTPAGELPNWSEADFIKAVTTGGHPSGGQLSEEMPRYSMSEDDLKSIFMYLKTIPAAESKK